MYYASRVEDFANDFNNPDLVLLGMEIWNASQLQVEKFIASAEISHPVLMDARSYADSLGYEWSDRNHFAVINKKGELSYKTGVDVDYTDGWQPDDLSPVIEAALGD